MTEDPGETLPRRFGEFELDKLISANETGRLYRLGGNRPDHPLCLRVWGGPYVGDGVAVQALMAGLGRCCGLRHGYVVEVSGEPVVVEDSVCSPMRWTRGRDLSALMAARGSMSWASTRAIVLDVCRGLVHAHEEGVVHGDLKPENIFVQDPLPAIGREKRALVMGFGAAPAYRRGLPLVDAAVAAEAEVRAKFSPYMSPEQVLGASPDVRSDIHALGVLMSHLLTGARPQATGWPPTVEQLGAPGHVYREDGSAEVEFTGAVEAEILKATAREPGARHPSVKALVGALLAADRSRDAAQQLASLEKPREVVVSPQSDPAVKTTIAMVLFYGSLMARSCLS